MKKIKKRIISAVLALSMGMTLMPTDFTGFRAYATNEAENGSANQRTKKGAYATIIGGMAISSYILIHTVCIHGIMPSY